jgi:tRNA pseudouridine-54 N-methylase
MTLRRFAVVGHRAMSKGKLPLNDLAGGAGRVDVLIRATMAALLTSHGLREDTEVVLHLMGGPGPSRRLRFHGPALKGLHAEERSIAGTIAKALREPLPAIGRWEPISPGFEHGGGNLQTTLREWGEVTLVVLDADAPRLWQPNAALPTTSAPNASEVAFVLSDDQPLEDIEHSPMVKRSLGDVWLQGHMAIGIVHFLLDEGVALNLG